MRATSGARNERWRVYDMSGNETVLFSGKRLAITEEVRNLYTVKGTGQKHYGTTG